MESLDPRRIGDTTKIQIQDGPGDFSVRGCQKRTCKRGKKKGAKLLCLALIYVAFVVFNVLHRVYNEINKQEGVEFDEVLRVKRDVISYGNRTSEPGLRSESDHKNCTTRSAEEFPGNFMTLKETRDGGVFAHILIVLYVFGALAIVCDDYFCASLEIICDELSLQEDVAGATFMAAGSSAPEFFTALIGVFIAESDVGVGTIVGSAVFNILFIVGVCGLFAGMIVRLTWYPVLRDSLYYLLSVAALIITIYDNEVQWYEGLVLVCMYVIYIILMYFNKSIEPFMEGLLKKIKNRKHAHKHRHEDHNSNQTEAAKPLYYENPKSSANGTTPSSPKADDETTFSVKNEEEECSSSEEKSSEGDEKEYHPAEGHKDSKEYESPWQIPDTFLKRIFWVAMIPMHALFFVTIPDCRRPGRWHKTYPVTFVMSIAWIAGLSYIMVWMVTVAGDALEIPETVMGLTLLAAGTSVPDCLSSLFVARDGLGDMAVSNSIGSNVFDILMCLGFPWLLKSLALEDGAPIKIQSEGLTYSAITLLSTVVFLLVAMFLTRWRLDKKFGVICLFVYVVVIIFSCLYELNVFGNFNISNYCPRD